MRAPGTAPENIDHEAHPQCPMRTHPCWGEGSSVFTGLAETHRALGGLYVDPRHGIAVGVDGVRVARAEFAAGEADVRVESVVGPGMLPRWWEQPFTIRVVSRGPAVVNGVAVPGDPSRPSVLVVRPDETVGNSAP